MTAKLEVPQLKPDPRPEPAMMGACQSGGCGGGPEPRLPPPPTFSEVRVNGVEIDPGDIAQEIQHHPAPDANTAWAEAARALAVRELLLQEAHRQGLAAEIETDEAGRAESDEDALISALLDAELAPPDPDDAECKRYYDANSARFRTPDLFEASHILIEPDGDSAEAWSTAGITARRIAQEVGDDATAFAGAAREFSCCPSAQQDGSLGQVQRGDLVQDVQQAIEALAPGKACRRPIRSGFGWHVIRLARVIDGQVLPFEAVRDKIADMMAARRWTMDAARYISRLAETGDVEGVAIEPEDAA
ncbi:peptidylprolyl isomerase [Mesorhizobium sp. A623]